MRVDHHNPPAEIHDGVPVELFSQPWGDESNVAGGDMRVGDMIAALAAFPSDSELRVAVPVDDTHHRCLTILSVGFGTGGEEVDGQLVVEITTERWEGQDAVIRMNTPIPATGPGA